MQLFVIYNKEASESQEEPMFWSDEDGWVDLYSATKFCQQIKDETLYLPGQDSIWMTMEEAKELV